MASIVSKSCRGLFSLPAAMFYCLVVSGLHETSGATRGPSALLALLASLLFLSSIGLWVVADARRRRISLPYDFGSFVFFAWPVVVPVYLFSTRGWRGFATIGWFFLIFLASILLTSQSALSSLVRP